MTNHLPVQRFMKKEKQGFRLASFAPVLSPIAHLPKPGFRQPYSKASQFCEGCRYKKHMITRFLGILFKIWGRIIKGYTIQARVML